MLNYKLKSVNFSSEKLLPVPQVDFCRTRKKEKQKLQKRRRKKGANYSKLV